MGAPDLMAEIVPEGGTGFDRGLGRDINKFEVRFDR